MIELGENNHGGNPDPAANRSDGKVSVAEGQGAPLVPAQRLDTVGSLDVEPAGAVIDEITEDFERSGGRDGLPVSVQDKDGCKIVGHGIIEESIEFEDWDES